MSDLGTGVTGYALEIDTNDSPQTSDDYTHYLTLEGAIAACIAIETELGISPSQSKATLLAYLSTEHDADGKHVFSGSQSFGDYDITNVGDIALDTISADDGSSFSISNDWTNAGNTIADLGIVTTIDIDGGTIDGAIIGGASPAAGTFTDLAATENITLSDAKDFILDTTTGSKLGTATSQKLGFWNATPVIQQSSVGETTGFTAGSGTGAKDDSTHTGNVGSVAYTVSDIVKHLKTVGILAS